ncbi:unnamed protein product [Ectocarpus fasciculatus]
MSPRLVGLAACAASNELVTSGIMLPSDTPPSRTTLQAGQSATTTVELRSWRRGPIPRYIKYRGGEMAAPPDRLSKLDCSTIIGICIERTPGSQKPSAPSGWKGGRGRDRAVVTVSVLLSIEIRPSSCLISV